MRTKLFILSAGLLLLSACSSVKENPIKVNQVGYYPSREKTAVLEPEAKTSEAVLLDAAGKTVWSGEAVREAVSPWSGKVRKIVDFSEVTAPGEYTLKAGKFEQPVVIREGAFAPVAQAGMKAYYLQRTGCPIEEQYAGVYARPAAHPDTCVMIHPSAASLSRPAGTIISSPLGWYDAGDFNKYVVNSGFTIGMLLLGYEADKAYYDEWNLNIPESADGTPDILDEIMYNLRWMATMQDPEDGSVYHKLTTPHFEGFIMPVDCHQPRYVVQKSTTAALDLAATFAQAYRIYKVYPEYQAFAAQMLQQAERAYAWSVKNPKVLYDQPGYNQTCEPEVSTGMYPDTETADEFFWAATELYLATGEHSYLEQAKQFMPTSFRLPVWGDIEWLGAYEWLQMSLVSNDLVAQQMKDALAPMLVNYLDACLQTTATSCFQMPYGNDPADFCWGGNAEICAGRGIAMLYGWRLTGKPEYCTAALEHADYLLGRNATGYCFVTGFGNKQVMHPHQRLSFADGIEAPLPGFLAGGPNPGQQDKVAGVEYHTEYPDESYLDEQPSYATNEIAINWNAYLVHLMAGVDAAVR